MDFSDPFSDLDNNDDKEELEIIELLIEQFLSIVVVVFLVLAQFSLHKIFFVHALLRMSYR